jgi:pimeloyl-ACP methyl ester carboxylesterase
VTPAWLDRAQYPFASRWIEVEGARMHYVDEGHGPTVLMVHGWYDTLWQRRQQLASIPALLVWGMKDPAFAKLLPRWRTVLSRAEVVAWPDVGHAPPEERGPESAALIARFLEDTVSRRTA